MAVSPAHRWGQIIGEVMEVAVRPMLEGFAATHHLYLDRAGGRPLHGKMEELPDLDQAIAYLERYEGQDGKKPVHRYEIQIRYSNGDRIEGKFAQKHEAIEFLQGYRPK